MAKTTKPENFRAWLDALRSGRYHQAEGALKGEAEEAIDGVGFCCLGVADDLCGLGRWEERIVHGAVVNVYVIERDGEEEASHQLLTPAVLEWLGLTVEDADLITTAANPTASGYTLNVAIADDDVDEYSANEWDSVADLNDNGMSFERIADLLEMEYL